MLYLPAPPRPCPLPPERVAWSQERTLSPGGAGEVMEFAAGEASAVGAATTTTPLIQTNGPTAVAAVVAPPRPNPREPRQVVVTYPPMSSLAILASSGPWEGRGLPRAPPGVVTFTVREAFGEYRQGGGKMCQRTLKCLPPPPFFSATTHPGAAGRGERPRPRGPHARCA